MKFTNDSTLTILMIGSAVALFMYVKSKHLSANTINNVGTPINGISEIFTGAKGSAIGAGWRYFTDGTSIGPDGTYYMNGQKVWSA